MDRREAEKKIVELVVQAQDIALQVGIPNILQPGLMKEMMIAAILGHEVICSKRDADACDPNDRSVQFEYLSCYEGGTGQLDRMFKSPAAERTKSLLRITRNKSIYLAIFFKARPLSVKVIYEIAPAQLLVETERQLDRSRNAISHVGFSENWAAENGTVVYQHK